MASSEIIELVSSDSDHHKSSNELASITTTTAATTNSTTAAAAAAYDVYDAYSASAYGDLDKLRNYVENDGASLSKPDINGYYALQWASLNNFVTVVQYIVEHGGDVNAVDNLQQAALHWAAVRGSLSASDVLLQNGARVEAADVNGYRAVHVAAQYGQTAFLNHIIAKYNADYDVPDNDGRSPLHWAAYKGSADTIRLLLFRDASQARQDKEGCTPLHWAAIRGNVEACTVLVYAGSKKELAVTDKAGFNPFQLASDKGHRHVAFFLTNAQKANRKQWADKVCHGKMGSAGCAPILFCIIITLMTLFINSVLTSPSLTKVTAMVGLWGWTTISLAFGSLIMLYRCSSKNPGFMKRSVDSDGIEDPLLSIDQNTSTVWTGNWSQLCPTCKIIRSIRSKHCPACNRCVEQLDHHCPWISNCVGKKNKWDFFIFICLATASSCLGAIIAVQRIWTAGLAMLSEKNEEPWIHRLVVQQPGFVAFMILDLTTFTVAVVLTISQASQIARNITTNELANAIRYGYLRGPDGRFHNPYNRGYQKNCADFLIYGYTNDDEVPWPLQKPAV